MLKKKDRKEELNKQIIKFIIKIKLLLTENIITNVKIINK